MPRVENHPEVVHPMSQTSKEAFFASLDKSSFAQVKANLATSVYLQGNDRAWAIEWLERASEASSAEQLSLARRSALAAETANQKANLAIAIAVTSIIITVVGMAVGLIVPHFWH